jgi:hypothetical protein
MKVARGFYAAVAAFSTVLMVWVAHFFTLWLVWAAMAVTIIAMWIPLFFIRPKPKA